MNLDVESNTENNSQSCKRNRTLFILCFVYHGFLNVYYTCMAVQGGLSFVAAVTDENDKVRFMGHFCLAFGTVWNAMFQSVFLFLSLSYDVLEWMNKQDSPGAKKLGYWRDVIFNGLVVPYTLFVAIMFWSLYSIDRELVFPKIYDTIIPWWFNHCVHTNIAIIILIETLLTPRRYPTNRSLELKLNSCVAFGYAIVYYSIFFFTNRWLYNVFGVMTWWQVCLYQLLIWFSSYFFYFLHFPINRLFHGCGTDDQKTGEEELECKEREDNKNEVNDLGKSFEVESMKKDGNDQFSSESWSLKYRSLRDKFENSRL